jgi:hypothetical protein
MTTMKLLIKLIILFVLMYITSCRKTLDINTDPNNPSIALGTPRLLFPAALLSTAGATGSEFAIIGGMWAQYWTQSVTANQYKTIDAYNIGSADYNRGYTELFSGALNNYQQVIEKSKASADWKYLLMATVMKAYTLQVLADLYDKVPYSEAFRGTDNLQPRFEKGEDVYTGLLAEIDSALAKDFLSGVVDPKDADADLVFGGNMERWKEFANTLKLKFFLRMVNASPQQAQSGIQQLLNSNTIFLSADAGISSFINEPGKSNPMYEYNVRKLNVSTNLRASRTLLTFLQVNNDSRLTSFYTNQNGINQGDFNNGSTANQSAGVVKQSPTDPLYFISAAESYLMQAEAIERYGGGAGAKAKYDLGVKAAFAQWAKDGAPYVAAGGVYEYPSTGLSQKLQAISTQKWISFFGSHALEGFFEKNRTGYPLTSAVYSTDAAYVPGRFVLSKNAVTTSLPKRLVFPDVERLRNNNTPAAVPITTPVWWAL